MKKYSIYAVLATSLCLWNCKTDELTESTSVNPNRSGARVAAPIKQWDLTVGGTQSDKITTAVNWLNGNVALGGFSNSPSTGERLYNTYYGGIDFWIINVGPDGSKQGKQSIGGSGDDYLTSMVMSADNGLLLGGYSNSPAGSYKSQGSKGYFDYYIVKLAASGSKLWDRTYGGSSQDYLSSIVATADGGYLLGGYSSSPADGDKTQDSKMGSFDYWIIKISANGAKQWDKTYGSRNDDKLTTIVPTTDGGFLLAGYSGTEGGGGDKTQLGRGNQDYWVVKIDASGNKQWDKVMGGTDKDVLASAVATADGGFLLGGTSASNTGGDKSQDSYGGTDYWLVKLDAAGTKQWDKTMRTGAIEELKSLVTTTDGGFLVGGTSPALPSVDKSANPIGGSDFWLIKLDATGTILWDKAVGSTGYDEMAAMVVTKDGGIVAAGYSDGTASGDKTENGRGLVDYWAVKIK